MMSLKYDWKEEYIAAILETDDEKLPVRLNVARAVMLSRVDFLNRNDYEAKHERDSLAAALVGLHKLRIERLGDCRGLVQELGFARGESPSP
jgi:hypothetical protein